MPELENTEELDTSLPVQDEADAVKAEQSADVQSSSTEDVSETAEEGSISIVRDVVSKSEEAPAAAASSATEANGQEADATQPTEQDNENFSDVPFNKHPRFQQVLGQLKDARTDATRYQNVEKFIDEQGLTADEAAGALQMGGLIKTNPVEAWKQMLPTIQRLAVAAGEVLPDDLKQRVQAGEVSRDVALDLSRQRAANQANTTRQDWERQRSDQRQVADTAHRVKSAVTAWENERRTRDPNFEAKLPAIEHELQRELAWLKTKGNYPRTDAEAKAVVQQVYDTVSSRFVAPAPPPRRQTQRPVTGGQVNGNVRPEITSTLDIINDVVARRAG